MADRDVCRLYPGLVTAGAKFFLTVPPEVARTLPEPVARLIGYEVHKPFLGFVTDFRDPYDMLCGYEEGSTGGRQLFADGEEALRQSSRVVKSS